MTQVPLIYTRLNSAKNLRVGARIISAAIALTCLAILFTAVRLKASHSGVGTHTEMGFHSCDFLTRTGLPCPTCGMTTSFSWFVRGNFLASAYVQPMGFVLAVLTAACAWTAIYVALTGKPAYRLIELIPYRYYLIPLMLFGTLSWGWKMLIHAKGIDGW